MDRPREPHDFLVEFLGATELQKYLLRVLGKQPGRWRGAAGMWNAAG